MDKRKKMKDPFDYIAKMISEKGEIVINNVDYDDYDEDDYDDELCVLCYDHYTGKPMNLVVDRIKEHSIVGRDTDSIFNSEIEVRACDWGGNTPKWIAEKVAENYGWE